MSSGGLTKLGTGPRILDWKKAGFLGSDVVFSHCNVLFQHTEVDDEMWNAMKEHECSIASTPADELNMAHGNPVALEAVDRGVKCGLGIVSRYLGFVDLPNVYHAPCRIVPPSTEVTYSRR